MYRFKLKAGGHYERDLSQPADPVTNRHPDKFYPVGSVVESHRRLDIDFGTAKFELLGGGSEEAHAPMGAPQPAAFAFPNGQVAQGHQVTQGDGPSRALTPEELTERSAPAEMPSNVRNELDDMTLAQLQEVARNEEIDLEGVHRKQDVLDRIKESLSARDNAK